MFSRIRAGLIDFGSPCLVVASHGFPLARGMPPSDHSRVFMITGPIEIIDEGIVNSILNLETRYESPSPLSPFRKTSHSHSFLHTPKIFQDGPPIYHQQKFLTSEFWQIKNFECENSWAELWHRIHGIQLHQCQQRKTGLGQYTRQARKSICDQARNACGPNMG